jgi:hypothetical protein
VKHGGSLLRLIDRPSEFTTRDCIRESTETKNNFALNLAHSRHAGMCVPLALARDHPSFCIQIGSRCFCTSLTHFSVVSLVQIGGLDRIGYFRSLISCTIPCSVISPAFSNAHTLCQSVCITTLSLVAYSGFWGGFLPAVWLGVPATLPTLCERIAPSLINVRLLVRRVPHSKEQERAAAVLVCRAVDHSRVHHR